MPKNPAITRILIAAFALALFITGYELSLRSEPFSKNADTSIQNSDTESAPPLKMAVEKSSAGTNGVASPFSEQRYELSFDLDHDGRNESARVVQRDVQWVELFTDGEDSLHHSISFGKGERVLDVRLDRDILDRTDLVVTVELPGGRRTERFYGMPLGIPHGEYAMND